MVQLMLNKGFDRRMITRLLGCAMIKGKCLLGELGKLEQAYS
jgi:hypothetical protein